MKNVRNQLACLLISSSFLLSAGVEFNGDMELGKVGDPVPGWRLYVGKALLKEVDADRMHFPVVMEQGKNGYGMRVPAYPGILNCGGSLLSIPDGLSGKAWKYPLQCGFPGVRRPVGAQCSRCRSPLSALSGPDRRRSAVFGAMDGIPPQIPRNQMA